MENNTNQIASNYCKRNCGFFGNNAFDGYCSKCYKEHVKRQNSGSAAGRVTPTSISVNSEPSTPASIATPTAPIPIPTASASSSSLIVNTTNNVPTTSSSTTSPVTFNLISNDIEIENTINDNNIINNNNNNNLTSNQNLNAPLSTSLQSTNSLASSLPENASSCSLSSSDGDKKTKRNRCNVDTCRRKLGLTGYDCRCGGIYCWEHRYSDKHSCQFDYKELGQEQIRKNNPVVVGEKINKI